MEHYGAKPGSPAWRVAHQDHMETALELKAAELEIKRLRGALQYIASGRRHPMCPTCADDRSVARKVLEL